MCATRKRHPINDYRIKEDDYEGSWEKMYRHRNRSLGNERSWKQWLWIIQRVVPLISSTL